MKLRKIHIINQINRILGYTYVNEGFIDLYSKVELIPIYKAVVIENKIPICTDNDEIIYRVKQRMS